MSTLIEQTLADLRELRLQGMAQAVEDQRSDIDVQELPFIDRLAMTVQREKLFRDTRKQDRLRRQAKFKQDACLEDIRYESSRGLDRELVANLMSCDYLAKSRNVIATGATGVGKSYLACALGNQAIRRGYSASYNRLSLLLEALEIAYGDGSLGKLRAKLAKVDLLILDDWALAPLTSRGRYELLELIDSRVGSGSVIITSQLPVDQWHDYIGEPTVADAILDRLVHSAHLIELKGESMRKKLGRSDKSLKEASS